MCAYERLLCTELEKVFAEDPSCPFVLPPGAGGPCAFIFFFLFFNPKCLEATLGLIKLIR